MTQAVNSFSLLAVPGEGDLERGRAQEPHWHDVPSTDVAAVPQEDAVNSLQRAASGVCPS